MRPAVLSGRLSALALSLLVGSCVAVPVHAQRAPAITISAVMIDPTGVPDALGEWLQLHNAADRPVSIAGWRLLSANDPGFTIPRGILIPAGADVILARNADPARNGGMQAILGYTGLSFANGGDWLVLRDASGVTRDSVAWGRAPRGVALRPHGGLFTVVHAAPPTNHPRERSGIPAGIPAGTPMRRARVAPRPVAPPTAPAPASSSAPASPASPSELMVRVLDIGQGDAILIQNGGSTILVDGGPTPQALGAHLDALGLNGTTIDAVILSHPHADHYQGLRELFAPWRRIMVRYLWENQDASPNPSLARLRAEIGDRIASGLVYRDTDDPCATGVALCTLTMRGGAKLEILRPDPLGQGANNRSAALKLVGPDSASFTMWMAGDGEQEALDFFERTGYAESPGMQVDVMKADHHGSCNGVSDRYLELLNARVALVSVGAMNDYGHMHDQAKRAYARHGMTWYRTDQNGTIVLRSAGTPGSRYTISVERGTAGMDGPSDRRSTQAGCLGMP